MATPTPTGRLVATSHGHDLILTRTLPLSIEEAWAYITDSSHTSRWFGAWKGTGAVGETVQLQLGFEETSPWMDVEITECDSPRLLRILNTDDNGSWDLSLELTSGQGTTELRFVMHNLDPVGVGEIGPGWEYYLDQLLAAIDGIPLPDFDDYFPAQREYYEQQRP